MTKGYYFDDRRNKYVVRVNENGERKYIGAFVTEDEARQAYIDNSSSLLSQTKPPLEATDMVFFNGLGKTIHDAIEDFAINVWNKLFKKA